MPLARADKYIINIYRGKLSKILYYILAGYIS